MRAKKSGGGALKDETATKPAVPPESDKEQKRNLAYLVVLTAVGFVVAQRTYRRRLVT